MKALFIFTVLVLASCGGAKPDAASFVVQRQFIKVRGDMKAGAKLSASQVETGVTFAVDMLPVKN